MSDQSKHSSGTGVTNINELADRPATPEEAARAEQARLQVDLEKVAEHEQEMLEKGANIKGEGEIEPS